MKAKAEVCMQIPPSSFLMQPRVFPFLGPLKVAGALEKGGVPVEVLDLDGYKNFADITRHHAAKTSAKVFGISATTPQLPAAVELADTIRQVRPGARIIFGGPHATLTVAACNVEKKKGMTGRAHRAYDRIRPYFDTIVAGDGEVTIFEAIKEDAPELIDADGKKSPNKSMFLDNESLTASAPPARHLIDLKSYSKNYKIDGVEATSLIGQLGCPFECGFCAGRDSPMLRHVRTRSTESIVEEMTQIYRDYGIRGFMFYDDELNVSPSILELMEAITRKQEELGVEWRLRGFLKAELLVRWPHHAKSMYRAGFRQVLVGFESGSPRILENINKKATQEENTECVAIAKEAGLKVKALMSIGHPGESSETVSATRDWLMQVKPFDFDVTVITPYPGSPYYDHAREYEPGKYVFECKSGDRLYQQEIDYTVDVDAYKGIPGQYVSRVWTDSLNQGEMVRWRDRLEEQVREWLEIPFNPSGEQISYEHSMGQTALPSSILRSS
jgi:anaerobic magnesium-protoporphyrin IX monomethyl ester cyclase